MNMAMKALESGANPRYQSDGSQLLYYLYRKEDNTPGSQLTGAFRSQFVLRVSIFLTASRARADDWPLPDRTLHSARPSRSYE